MTREELDVEFTVLIGQHYAGPVPDRLVGDLLAAASAYTASQIERYARPHPWPPPRRKRLDEARAGRQQQPETRRTA